MDAMFEDAQAFNQNLSGWCVSNIPEEPEHFAVGAVAWSGAWHPGWGSCSGSSAGF